MEETLTDILNKARRTLRNAELALTQINSVSDPEKRVAQIHNVIIWGRAVTPILQQLRGTTDRFNQWYAPWRKEMELDPFLKYVYGLRNLILKEGRTSIGTFTYISKLNTSQLGPPPSGAESIFIGDQLGGSGWVVRMDDGSTQKVYAQLPQNAMMTWFFLPDMPHIHLNTHISDLSAENACNLYITYLKRLVRSAEIEFGEVEPSTLGSSS